MVIGSSEVELGLSTAEDMCPKQLISMGAYLLIWPDKKYVNTQNISDHGSMEHTETTEGTVTVTLCKTDGTQYGAYTKSATAPANPGNGDLWMDVSVASVPVLKELVSMEHLTPKESDLPVPLQKKSCSTREGSRQQEDSA